MVGLVGLVFALGACAEQQGDEETTGDDRVVAAEDADVEIIDTTEDEVGSTDVAAAAAALSNAQWRWAERVAGQNMCEGIARPNRRVEVRCPIATDRKVYNAYRAKLGKSHVGRTSVKSGYYIVVH